MAKEYKIPNLPLSYDLETKAVLKQLNLANKKLAELKGVALTIPNESILISTLTLQEAKESSSVENIVTTQDDLFKEELNIQENISNAAAKEVLNYRRAMQAGFELVKKNKLLTCNIIQQIQSELESNRAAFKVRLRKLLGNKYKHDLLNNLFRHPYTKIEYVEKDMLVTRQTASKYLDKIVEDGLLTKMKLGKDNYYINDALCQLFINQSHVNKTGKI